MKKLILAAAALTPTAALAHPGHEVFGFGAGVMHPLTGTDHLLAMLGVGLLAAVAGGRALWAAPLTFVGAMLAGGAFGAGQGMLAGVEPMILASIILLGAAVALAARMPLMLMLPMLALFGAAHGVAHGAEGADMGVGLAEYAAGFALATAALHGAGLVLGAGLARVGTLAPRLMGGSMMAAGLALAVAG